MKSQNLNVQVNSLLLVRALCAERILEKSGIDLLDAARLAKNFVEMGKTKRIEGLRRIFCLGIEALARERQTQDFASAFKKFIESKSHLRERTLSDYRQVARTIFRKNPRACSMKLRSISAEAVQKIVAESFRTPLQRAKARAVLHAFFAFALKSGWCGENPIRFAEFSCSKEREIIPLSIDEIEKLLCSAKKFKNGECLPAIAVLLFAGIRPRELERLHWADIDWEEKVVSISPTHSKTGGRRHVSIQPRLEKILREYAPPDALTQHRATICPANWTRKWRKIRVAAGWKSPEKPWQQDVLRHTFASYHLKFFKNEATLQCEMGHSSARLLRTRYLSMRGINASAAEEFWGREN